MRKTILVNFVMFVVLAALVLPANAGRATFSHKSMMRMLKANRITVVATTPALGDIAKAVGGDKVVVSVLSKDESAPKAYHSVIQALKDAQVLLRLGDGFDSWVNGLIKTSGNTKFADVDTAGDSRAAKVLAGLIAASPENRDYFQSRYEALR